jgi:O-antigen/teichoic acid export membrane protein
MISLYLFFEIVVFFDDKWDMGDLKIYVMFTTLFFLFQDFLRRYFIIKAQYYKLIFIDSIAYLGQISIISYFIYINNLELNTALLAIAISFLLSLVIGYMQVSRVATDKQYKKLIFLKNWKFSKWLVYSAVLQWGSGNFFILAGGAILGSWSVGVIRVMQNTMGVFHVLFIALENILPINFSKIYSKNGYKSMMNYFKLQMKYGSVIFSILAILVYKFAPNIIEFIYGDEYTKYAYLLIGFVGIYLFIYITMLQRYILRTIEMTKIIFISYIVTTMFAFLSSYPLIEYFKIDGILIGMFMIQLIMVGIFYQYIMKSRLKYV